jgi:hypothetical protein
MDKKNIMDITSEIDRLRDAVNKHAKIGMEKDIRSY